MSNDTLVAETPPPAPPHRSSAGDKVRFVLRGIGQTLITLGLVVLLFIVYEVWITGIFARDDNNRIKDKTEQLWAEGRDTLPSNGSGTIPLGTGVANIYVPRLGQDYHWTIVEGTGQDQLAEGPGHYPGTALPGKVGNFGVAGHRVGKGEPFLNLDKLRVDDAIIIETKSSWFVYRVLGAKKGSDPQDNTVAVQAKRGGSATKVSVPGREIVQPSAGKVLDPVPDNPGLAPVERLLTLTTCHPKFTAEKRMIIHAAYDGQTSAVDAQGKHVAAMPAPIKALYSEVTV